MACSKEINDDANLLLSCLADTDQFIILREVSGELQPFRITYGKLKDCLIAPPLIAFTVDDPANEDTDELTFPLGGGAIFFASALIGRRSVIVMVNNNILPQRAVQLDYCTPDFTAGEITRPYTWQSGDYVEIYIL